MLAGDLDFDLRQFLAKNVHRGRQPFRLAAAEKPEGQRRFLGVSGCGGGFDLGQREPGMIENDAAVNTAGTEGKPGPATEQTAESYAATFDTNVLGTLLSMKHELRVMQAQGGGSIVNISSTYGHEGGAGASVYVASKHAVEGMTKSAALEAASSGVRVNAVAPGPIETGMLKRFTGTVERKAALVKTVPLGRVG